VSDSILADLEAPKSIMSPEAPCIIPNARWDTIAQWIAW